MIEADPKSLIISNVDNKPPSPKLNPKILKYINDKLDSIETKLFNKNSDFISLPNTHFQKPNNSIFNDICSICSEPIYYQKYICCFCNNIICPSCEPSHNFHPLFKLSSNSLHTFSALKQFIQSQAAQNIPPDSFKQFKLNVHLYSTKFSMRRNQKIKYPIKLTNISNQEMSNNEMFIIATGGKDLNIPLVRIKERFNINESKVVYVNIMSLLECKLYTVFIEVYCKGNNAEFVYVNGNKVIIDVNNDYEEDELNEKFGNEEMIIILEKEKKIMLEQLAVGVKWKGVSMGGEVPKMYKNYMYLFGKLKEAKWNLKEALSVVGKEMENDKKIQEKVIMDSISANSNII